MKEYKIVRLQQIVEQTEAMLNELAQQNWEVVCSYAHNNEFIILERTKSRH